MAKRDARRGTLRRRKDGRAEARVWIQQPDGTKKRLSVYARTATEAAAKLDEKLDAEKKGLAITGDQQTVAEFLRTWLRDVAKPRLRPKVDNGYEFHVERTSSPRLARCR